MNYDTKLDEIINTINLKTIEVQNLDNDIEVKKKLIIDLNNDQSHSEGKLLNIKQKITREESIQITLESENATLNEDVNKKKKELESLKEVIGAKRNEVNIEMSSLESYFNNSKAEKDSILTKIESEITQANNQLTDLKSQLMSLDNAKTNAEKQIKELEKTKTSLSSEVDLLTENTNHLEKLVAGKHTDIKLAELQLNQTQEQIEKIRKDIIGASDNLKTLNELRDAAKYETEQMVKQKMDVFKTKETLDIREAYIKSKFVQAGIPYK